MDRRTFVKTLAGLAGAAAVPLRAAAQLRAKTDSLSAGALQPAPAVLQRAAPAPAGTSTSTSASTSSTPAASTKSRLGYASGPLALLIDGAFAGMLTSVEGGDARAEVVLETAGNDGHVRKHLGSYRYSDFTIEVAEAPSGATTKWIQDTLERKTGRRSGAVLSLDVTGAKAAQRQFAEALITSVTFPMLDASDKSAVHLAIAFAPEYSAFAAGDASKVPASAKASAKVMRGANFKLSIDGLDSACAHVSKIEALTIKQKVSDSDVGTTRVVERSPGKLEVSDSIVTLADTHAQPFYDWHEDAVIKGNTQNAEKAGKLELLSADLKDVLMTLTFQGLGIHEARPLKVTAGASELRRSQVSMYLERVILK